MTTPQASTSRTPRKEIHQDAIALLKSDHRKVEDLFEEHEKARKAERKQLLVSQICDELTVHAQLEEQEFYPKVQEALPNDGDLVAEARVEHASLKWLIEQLQSEDAGSELYDAKVKVLQEYVAHHVKEEEKQMFPKVRKSDLDLDALGEAMAQVKDGMKKALQH